MKGKVYAIQNKGLVKIGRSFRPEARIKNIQTQGGFAASNIFISPEYHLYDKVEIRCHEKLAMCRVVGEWFSVSFDEAVNCIKETIVEICTPEAEEGKEQELSRLGDFCNEYFSQINKRKQIIRDMFLAEWTDEAIEFCLSLGIDAAHRISKELFLCPSVTLIGQDRIWICYPRGFDTHKKDEYIADYDKEFIAKDIGCEAEDVADWDTYSVNIEEQHRLAA